MTSTIHQPPGTEPAAPARAATSAAPHAGRFAPSPTGPLHFGSLVAALASHAAARAADGRWHVRIDDLDGHRHPAGATDAILRQLEGFGFRWDGEILFQSRRGARYAEALERLRAQGVVYPCTCTRKEIGALAPRGELGPVYPGLCRAGVTHPGRRAALRLRLPPGPLTLVDAMRGRYTLDAGRGIGDAILRRRDGVWAYHLATTVDDAALGITEVVRGADLLPATLIQVYLQERLGLPAARWSHLPIARTAAGAKLSKQTGAAAIDPADPLPPLLAAWRFLGQPEPPERPADVDEFHAWARTHWSPARVPAHGARSGHPTMPIPP